MAAPIKRIKPRPVKPRSPTYKTRWAIALGQQTRWAGIRADGSIVGSIEEIEKLRGSMIRVGVCVVCRTLVFQTPAYVETVTGGRPELWEPRHQRCIGRTPVPTGGGRARLSDLRAAWIQALQVIIAGKSANAVREAWGLRDHHSIWRASDEPDRQGAVNRVLRFLPAEKMQSQEPLAASWLREARRRAGSDASARELHDALTEEPVTSE